MDVEVAIVGGGLGGLLLGVELARRGREVAVAEAADRPGGVAVSDEVAGYELEPAAGTLLLPNAALEPIVEYAGATVEPADPAAKLRFVWTGDRLVAVPASPKAVLAPLVSWRGRLRAAAEPFIRARGPEDETLDGFLRRRLGDELGGLVAGLAAGGVHAGDPGRLEARSAFPGLVALEEEAGSIVRGAVARVRRRPRGRRPPASHLPVGGMRAFAESLAASLGTGWLPSNPVERVIADGRGWRIDAPTALGARHVVVALRPEDAVGVVPPPVGELLGKRPSSPIAVAWLGGPRERLPLPAGFGYLAPSDPSVIGIGCLFESSYAPRRAPSGHALAKVVVGGARHPEAVSLDDATMVDRVADEMARILGVPVEPEFSHVVRHPRGIPQYEVGHRRWLAAVDRRLTDHPGLHLAGWGYRAIGVAHLAADACRIADLV